MAAQSFLTLTHSYLEPLLLADTYVEVERQAQLQGFVLGDLSRVPVPVMQCLVTRVWGSRVRPSRLKPKKLGARELMLVSNLSMREAPVTAVGLIDMGAYFPMPKLMRYPNVDYPEFLLFEIFSAVPGGLVKYSPFLERWADSRGGLVHTSTVRATPGLIASEFHAMAESLRETLKLDYLLGATDTGLAVEKPDGVHAGLLYDTSKRTSLVSGIGFHGIARSRNWTYAKAIRPWIEATFDAIRANGSFCLDDKQSSWTGTSFNSRPF